MEKSDGNQLVENLYEGLQSISNLSFPKQCATCGKRYETAEDFIKETDAPRKSTGLKQEIDDDQVIIVELFRNCSCGSTLMDEFNNRRDLSEAGLKRREKFEELVSRLKKAGYRYEVARTELLNIMRGKGSRLLNVKKADPKTQRTFIE